MDGQPARIAFIDTETTSLRPDRRAWDVAIVARHRGRDVEWTWFVAADDLDLGNADLMSLNIGRFYDRHPQYRLDGARAKDVSSELTMLREVEAITRGAQLVGAVPSFDADVLAARMRAHGITPSWHYHLQDFETLIVGYLRGQGRPLPPLPWKSDELSRLIGVDPPADGERHTALGDARWAARAWDAVMTDAPPPIMAGRPPAPAVPAAAA